MNFNIFKDNPAIYIIIIMFVVGCTIIFVGSIIKDREAKKKEQQKIGVNKKNNQVL
jgi:hypothetical protein